MVEYFLCRKSQRGGRLHMSIYISFEHMDKARNRAVAGGYYIAHGKVTFK